MNKRNNGNYYLNKNRRWQLKSKIKNKIISLYFDECKQQEEIAKIMGMAPGSIGYHIREYTKNVLTHKNNN